MKKTTLKKNKKNKNIDLNKIDIKDTTVSVDKLSQIIPTPSNISDNGWEIENEQESKELQISVEMSEGIDNSPILSDKVVDNSKEIESSSTLLDAYTPFKVPKNDPMNQVEMNALVTKIINYHIRM